MRELTEDICGLILSTIEDLPDVEPLESKARVWNRLGNEWNLDNIEAIVTEIEFTQLQSSLDKVLKGQAQGRFVLNLGD